MELSLRGKSDEAMRQVSGAGRGVQAGEGETPAMVAGARRETRHGAKGDEEDDGGDGYMTVTSAYDYASHTYIHTLHTYIHISVRADRSSWVSCRFCSLGWTGCRYAGIESKSLLDHDEMCIIYKGEACVWCVVSLAKIT